MTTLILGGHPVLMLRVVQAYQQGVLTSASLMVNGKAFEGAAFIRSHRRNLPAPEHHILG